MCSVCVCCQLVSLVSGILLSRIKISYRDLRVHPALRLSDVSLTYIQHMYMYSGQVQVSYGATLNMNTTAPFTHTLETSFRLI